MITTIALRNIIKNKTRTIAIIITIALSAVMLFLSLIYSHIIYEEFLGSRIVEAENADIRIEYSPASNTRIISANPLNAFTDDIEYAVGILELYGTANHRDRIEYISLKGILEEGLSKINNITYLETLDRPLRKDEIIISRSTSEELKLNINSSIAIKVGNIEKTFYVGKIAEDHLCFVQAGAHVIYGIETYVSEFIGLGFGKVYNKIFIKTNEGVNQDTLLLSLSQISEYKNYLFTFEEDTTDIDTQARDVSLPVTIGTVCCVGLALILIYLIFDAGIKKRSFMISQLKSVGASNSYIAKVFIFESLFYTFIGLILGSITNRILISLVIPRFMDVTVNNYYSLRIYLSAFISGFLVFIMVILPIIKSFGVSVRQAYVESKNTVWKGNIIILIIGLIMIISSLILVIITPYLSNFRGILSITLALAGTIIVIPYIIKYVSFLLMRIDKVKGVWYLALNNLYAERSIRGNVRILIAGIIICSLIATSASLTSANGNQVINEIDGDIIVRNVRGDNDNQLNIINDIEGVYDVIAFQFERVNFQFGEVDYHFHIMGFEPDQIKIMGDLKHITPEAEAIAVLNSNDSMLIDYMYYKVYKINIGDYIPITINKITHNIRVGGFYQSYQYGGRTAIINSHLLAERYQLPLYNTIILKTTSDIDKTVMDIRINLGTDYLIVLNKYSVYKLFVNIMNNTITFAYYFTFLLILVCFTSIFTNIINSRDERKSTRYQMISLGISRYNLMIVEIIESIIISFICFIVSLIMIQIINLAIANIFSISSVYLDEGITPKILLIIGSLYITSYIITSATSYFSIKKSELITVLKG